MTSFERRPETLVLSVRFAPSWNHIEPLRRQRIIPSAFGSQIDISGQ